VNLASRLESQTKTYGIGIILGEATRNATPDWAALELDLIAVKGKQETVRIYGLLGDAALAGTPGFAKHAASHARMLAAYRAQDWDGARNALDECRGQAPRFEGFYDLYAERIAYFEVNPPPEDWQGEFIPDTK